MQVIDWRINELKSGSTIVALCHKDSKLHVVNYKQSCPDGKQFDSIDLTTVFSSYKAQFALYHQKRPEEKGQVSVKRTQILDLVAAANDPYGAQGVSVSVIINREASICNRLSSQPHPNVVQFLGVQVSDELIFVHEGANLHVPLPRTSVTGLVFKKHDCTLDELVIRGHKVDVKLCVKSIAAAIQHLHKMALVHGNISPHNIYVLRGKEKNSFVLGGLSGAYNTGDVITVKTGANGWSRRKRSGLDQAEEEDDWYALRKLTEWLINETGGSMEDFAGIEALARH
ncbi:hypothetical protein E8E12_005993 [Didymella heteroderae]|uniref:Protein kinase domain-containing protein n=1 Tax=Didymella heteroderae TaxID=1769908 RepID=A0A9P4WQ40_9PLEO|nr:hypothetical protein E8E12_005993 [Didymella heteroderae]